jgi:hypothetical protein
MAIGKGVAASLRSVWLPVLARLKVLSEWWRAKNRRYGWRWRAANVAAVVLVLSSVVIPIAQEFVQVNRYKLSAEALQLAGSTDPSLSKQLSYDAEKQLYQFNKNSVKADDLPSKLQQSSVGAENKSNTKSYALDVPVNFSKGVTYHDTNSQLSFSMVPEFRGLDGKIEQGHIVFPLDGGNQAVYTLKNNGLKEDIIVPKVTADTMRFSYQLQLPKTLEARVIPGSGGALGVYSADPMLFGDISFGSNQDRSAVEQARLKGAKSFLVFGLPAPYIKAANGGSIGKASARFELRDNRLSVIAENLSGINTPITIDPSVVVTSTSDFQSTGNDEGMIDFLTSGQITRGGLTGGSIGSWTQGTSFTTARNGQGTVAYGGYMYVLGGDTGSSVYTADTRYAAIGTNGVLGSWAATGNNLPAIRGYFTAVAYNGYMYVAGGVGASNFNDVLYSRINSDGTLGSWTTTSSFTNARRDLATVVHNGYFYVLGGNTGSVQNDVQYAAINADGTLGSFSSTTSFTTARRSAGVVVNNNYMYVIGGDGGSAASQLTDVQYAPINANGTVGTWVATTSYTGGRSFHATALYNGYLYVMGGYNSSFVNLTDVQYAPFNANGTIGAWSTTTVMPVGRFGMRAVAYDGYLHFLGGGDSTPTRYNTTYYAPIATPGIATAYTASGNAFTTTRRGHQTVVYDSYLYIMGGDNGGTPVNTIYKATIAADGTIGTFSSTTAFTTNRTFFSAVAYNGYMYVLGGCSSAFSSCTTAGNNLATVYKSTISETDGTLGSWSAQTSFTTARYGLSAVAYNGYMYVLGGVNGSTFQSDIQYHAFGASGAISGAWTTSAKTVVARAYAGAVVNAGNLYIAGGCTAGAITCTTVSNAVYYAALASSGDLNANLTTNGTSFTNSRGMFGLAPLNGYMYVVGGWGGSSTYYGDTQYAPINADGSIGTWATSSTSTLANNVQAPGVVATNGSLYSTGGYNGTTYYTSVQIAQVNNGGRGTLNAYSTSGTLPGSGLADHAAVAYNGYLYAIGGDDGFSNTNDVRYAPLNADGTVGTWTTDPITFSTGRVDLQAVVLNGFLYVLGGYNGTSTYYKDIQYAPVGTSGALTGSFASAGSNTTNGGEGSCVVTYGDKIYSIGGWDGSSDYATTQYATQAANGTIGSWSTTSSISSARSNGACTVNNGYMYYFGGESTIMNNDAQFAVINGDGTLGTWTQTTAFPFPRRDLVAMPANGFMYLVGGWVTSGTIDVTLYAAINSNGTLGPWQQTARLVTFTLRDTAAAYYNGRIYIPGGYDTQYRAYTQVAVVNSIPRKATYSKLINLGSLQNINGVSYNGSVPGGLGSIKYYAYGANGVLSSNGLGSAISATSVTSCDSNLTAVRYLRVVVTLDDTSGTAFRDALTTPAFLTDFTVNYVAGHPASNIRLRHGQTLQSGGLSPLDTCY